ncbi:hypothetical protein Bbelb_351220 [Branchiostoma belcheri]|nr:hypothetical protein Bbelb_351220 [Branchiostoma belcheri]
MSAVSDVAEVIGMVRYSLRSLCVWEKVVRCDDVTIAEQIVLMLVTFFTSGWACSMTSGSTFEGGGGMVESASVQVGELRAGVGATLYPHASVRPMSIVVVHVAECDPYSKEKVYGDRVAFEMGGWWSNGVLVKLRTL